MSESNGERASIAFVSDYTPRRCGIATFTQNLCEAVARQAGESYDVFVAALNDIAEGYPYPPRVRFEIREAVQADYRMAAEYLNVHQVWATCLQHEYGIYGGTVGSHVLALLRRLRRPLIVTLHTVLKSPNDSQRLVLQEIGKLSNRLVVMSDIAGSLLKDVYDIPAEKVAMIPHGIPDMPFVDPNFYKDKFGSEGRKLLLTFGLLSPGKGIEYVIEALPAVVKKHPDVLYMVLGATHPHVKRESGEEYRNGLARRVDVLGLGDHVVFQNRFVETEELCEFLGAADMYITPYLGEDQITSGTLAYALGAGKAAISTPYWYAKEMLAEGRGRLVPFRDSDAIAQQVIDLLDNEVERTAMRKRAYAFCRRMIWQQVAQEYLDLMAQAAQTWEDRQYISVPRPAEQIERPDELPETDLRHLRIMTDETGMIQHCLYATPNRRHGYCTDDNARALILTTMQWDQRRDASVIPLMQTYLAFLAHAMDEKTGRFRNFMTYERTWLEVAGSEDSHARALWGLGVATALCPHESMIALATRLFRSALPAVESLASPRAWAFALVGMHAYLRRFGGDSEVRRSRIFLVERLAKLFTDNMIEDWPWCENTVTYDNGKLPHALLMSGKWLQRPELVDIGCQALDWLLKVQTNEDGMLSVIGTDGWYPRGGQRARFDQQPVEAHALVDACIEAYHVTRDRKYLAEARRVFNWFLGDNDVRTPLYDFTTGGCRDGLMIDRINENQGAESTLAFLLSLLLMHELQMEETLGQSPADKQTGQRPVPRAVKASGPVVAARVKAHARSDRSDK